MSTPINPPPLPTAFSTTVRLRPRRSMGRRVATAFAGVLVPALLLAMSVSCFRFLQDKQGSGNVVTEQRIMNEAFEGVQLAGSPTLNVTVDPNATELIVEVTTDDNLLIDVTTEVIDGVLVIGTEGNISPTKGIRLDVTVPRLTSARLLGSGDINVAGLDADAFTSSLTGSGDIKLQGKAASADLGVTGSGTLNAVDLEAASVKAKVTGSGDIELKATQSADVGITGSGDVTVHGQPPQLSRKVTGSGSVHVK